MRSNFSRRNRVACLIVLYVVMVMLTNCSHTQKYTAPVPLYEPVYLTAPPDPEMEKYRTDDYLLSQLNRHFDGGIKSEYASEYAGKIDSATLSPTEDFWLSEGYVLESLEYQYIADAVITNDRVYPSYQEPYLYEWSEWSQVRPPSGSVSVFVYSYDPWFYDPYWSRNRVYSYHAPFHYSHRYLHGYSGFGYYPYHYRYLSHYPYYYYPVYKKPRKENLVEQPREQRTGVDRNPSPTRPLSIPTTSSTRSIPRSYVRPSPPSVTPSMNRIFTSPQRQSVSSKSRSPSIFSGQRSDSSPRFQIETNRSTGYSIPKSNSYSSPSTSPGRSMSRPVQQSSRRSSYTKPSR